MIRGDQVVLFDAVGTLLEPVPSAVRAYMEVGRRHGARLTEPCVAARFAAACARQDQLDQQQHGGATSEDRERGRWRAIVGDVFPDAADAETLFQALWDHFAAPEHWRLYDDATAAWRALAARGLTLGVASNFDQRLESIALQTPLLADCRRIFVSSRLGYRKPHVGFFRQIEALLRLPAERMALVGDDPLHDAAAARAAGWSAILVDRAGRQANPAGGITTVASLAELIDLVVS